MKTSPLLISFAILLFNGPLDVFAVTGSLIDIGPSGSNSFLKNDGVSPSNYAGAIGESNTVADRSFAVGLGNFVSITDSMAVGFGNHNDGYAAFALGEGNQMNTSNSAVIGILNYSETGADNSLTVGDYNDNVGSVSAILVGRNNVVTSALASATFGQGLINNWSLSTVVGSYNDDTVTGALRFAVGNGTDAQRSNALEVFQNGKLKINGYAELFAPDYSSVNATLGKIVLQPSIGGSSITVDGQAVLTANSISAQNFHAPSFSFGTGSNNWLNINSVGNIGIGTSSPVNRLDVVGNTSVSGNLGIGNSSPSAKVDILQNANTTAPALSVVNSYGSPGGGVALFQRVNNLVGGSISNPALALVKIKEGGGVPFFVTNGSEANPYFIIQSTGNVGIGTSAPGSLLTVAGRIAGGASVASSTVVPTAASYILGNDANSGSFYIGNTNTTSSSANMGFVITQTSGEQRVGARIYSSWANSNNQQARLDFHVKNSGNDSNPVMSLLYNGNVGIGTTNPQAKFHAYNDATAIASGSEILRLGALYSGSIVGSGGYLNFADASNTVLGQIRSTLEANGQVGLSFSTYNGGLSERVRIANSGSVGIGTVNPAAKLDVNGDARFAGAINLFASNYNPANANSGKIVIQPSISGSSITIDGQPLVTATSAASQTFIAPSYSFNSGSTNRMTINANGDIGIGTSSPTAKLQIANGDVNVDSGRFFSSSNNANGITGLQLSGVENSEYLALWTADTERLHIDHEGNVGIGTASPHAKLEIAGSPAPFSQSPPVASAVLGRSIVDWHYEQGGDDHKYYTKLADVSSTNGSVQIEGLIGGHTIGYGKATINLLVSERDSAVRTATVTGNLGYSSDIQIFKNANNSSSVYLVTKDWAEVTLRLVASATSNGTALYPNPTRTTVTPAGTLAYTLSQNAQYTFGHDGAMKVAKRQGDIKMGEFGIAGSND